MRHPLVPIVAAFATGIWAAPYFYLSAWQQVLCLAAVLLFALVLLRIERFTFGFVLALMGFFLCGTFLAAEEHAVLPRRHIELLARRGAVQPEQPVEITGWARTPSIRRPGLEVFDFQLTGLKQSESSMPAEGIIRLYYYPPRNGPASLGVVYGQRFSISMRNLRRPRNYLTENNFDYEAYLRRQGIYFNGIVRRAEDARALPGNDGGRVPAALYAFRERMLSNLDRLFPPERDPLDQGAILKAMLLGDDDWLSTDTTSVFQDSGTYHLLVVAGLHIGALAWGLFLLFSWLRLSDWLQTLLVLACIMAFAFMANSRIPTIRATLMISCYLVARLIYRERALLNSIAAAALILLLLHPSDLRESGFQLSFLAVSIIAVIAVPLVEWTVAPLRRALRDLDHKERDLLFEPRQAQFRQDLRVLLDYFCGPSRLSKTSASLFRTGFPITVSAILAIAEATVAVTLMQAGLAILMARFFHRVVWSGVAANLLVLPLAGLLVPLGFWVLWLSVIWWPLAQTGAWVLGWLVSMLKAVAAWRAHLPRLALRVADPPAGVTAAFFAVLLLIAILAARRSRLVWWPIAALVALCVVLTFAPYPVHWSRGRLEVTALDVGQGDSLFINFPGGRTMLVDGGGVIPIPGEPPPRFDTGEEIVSPFLWSRRLKTIDVVVLTHAHTDHLGGLSAVLRNFQVGELWLGPGPSDAGLERLLNVARSRGVPIVLHHSGDDCHIDGVELLVLSPPADWSPKRVSNNDSLVMRLGYGSRHILLLGDVEARMEKRLAEGDLPLSSEIMKVAHHGSKTSTTAPLLSRVAPRFGMISVGAFSRFGHPNREVLEALHQAGVWTYRTDDDGSISASTDGYRIEFSRFRDSLRPWPAFP